MAKGENKLWVEVLRRKYLRGRSFVAGKWRKGDSLIWKAVMSTKEIIRRGAYYKVGNGWSIDLQNDPWAPGFEQLQLLDQEGLFECREGRVANLINPETFTWDIPTIESIYNREKAAAIVKLKLPEVCCEDKLCWKVSKDGKFSVKSCFAVIQEFLPSLEKYKVWGIIWGADLHERHKLFLWHLVSNVLPTKSILASRLGGGDTFCTFCGQEEEDTLHLFKQCPSVRAIGFASQWSLRIDGFGFAGDSMKEVIKLLPVGADQLQTLLLLKCLWYSICNVCNNRIFKGSVDLQAAVWNFERMVIEFGAIECSTSPAARPMIKWKPPSPGRLSISFYALVGGGLYASAMMVRNHCGNLIFCAIEWGEDCSPNFAEC